MLIIAFNKMGRKLSRNTEQQHVEKALKKQKDKKTCGY
jgi:hypothetical protein